ncbi:MAG: hypothetical protein Q8M37_07750 [Nevskia sp.]|nr:hypothetical protein [Nevskia sp.]
MDDYQQQNGSHSSDALASSAHDLATHAEELMRQTAAVSSDSIAVLREKLQDSLRSARTQIASAQDYAMERGKQAVTATDSYVHEKPWQAIAIAALAGALIGFISSGSRR